MISAGTIMMRIAMATATIMTATSPAIPTAVITELIENTRSSRKICAITLAKLTGIALAVSPSSLSSLS